MQLHFLPDVRTDTVEFAEEDEQMNVGSRRMLAAGVAVFATAVAAQDGSGKKPSSYSPVVIQEDFASVMKRMSAAKPGIMKQHQRFWRNDMT